MTFIDNLLKYGQRVEYKKDELIFMQGDIGKHMYIILTGKVSVYINAFDDFPIKIDTIYEKSFFGEMSIIDDEPRSATIIAETDCVLYSLTKEDFNNFMANDPDMSLKILSTLSKRIRNMNDNMATMKKAMIKEESKKPEIEKETDADNITNMVNDAKKLYNKPAQKVHEGYLYEKLFNCPVCKNAFKAKYPLFTKLVTLNIERDLRRIYKEFDILPYTIIVCPKCCYANIYSSFNEIKIIEPAKKVHLELNLKFSGFSEPRTIDEVVESYYLALKCSNVLKVDYSNAAKILIRLSWLYKDLGEKDKYTKILAKTLECYEYIYRNGPAFSSIDRDQQLNTILAELYLAFDKREEAIKHYIKVFKLGRNGNLALYEQSLDVLNELGIKRADIH